MRPSAQEDDHSSDSRRSGARREGRSGGGHRTGRRARGRESAPSPLGAVAGWGSTHKMLLVTLGVIAVVILFLYGPTQRYYVAWRTQGDEEAKAEALDADNEALKEDIDRLTTREGVEDEARRLGYAYPSEDTSDANVNLGSDSPNKGSNATDSGFSYADIEQPWFIHVLDFIFVYNGPVD